MMGSSDSTRMVRPLRHAPVCRCASSRCDAALGAPVQPRNILCERSSCLRLALCSSAWWDEGGAWREGGACGEGGGCGEGSGEGWDGGCGWGLRFGLRVS